MVSRPLRPKCVNFGMLQYFVNLNSADRYVHSLAGPASHLPSLIVFLLVAILLGDVAICLGGLYLKRKNSKRSIRVTEYFSKIT